MGLIVTTPPAAEPLSLADAKRQCRIALDETREDPELQGYIVAARREAERTTGLILAVRTLRYTFDCFPEWELELPAPPLLSVASIKYVNGDGTLTTVDAADYSVITSRVPGFVEPVYGGTWPTPREQSDACQVNFVAGFPVTTIAAAVGAGAQTVTPASMAGIAAGAILTIDVGAKQEQVAVTSVTATTFTATFAQAHTDLPVPINCVPQDIRAGLLLLVAHWYRNREEVITGTITARLPMAAEALLQGNWTGTYMGPS